MWRACESIMQVIKDRTKNMGNKIIGYYEAVMIAYTESEYMQKYLDATIKDVVEIKHENESPFQIKHGEMDHLSSDVEQQ
jgi:hypothetical protein